MVEYLLSAGADPNVEDESGLSALHYAAYGYPNPYYGRKVGSSIIDLLLAKGLNVNKPNHQGQTPLFIALSNLVPDSSQKQIVQSLIRGGASFYVFSKTGTKYSLIDKVNEWKVKDEKLKQYRNEILELLEQHKN